MRCYYEELGVERDANDADIKSAYRKLALRWHPDKNLDRLEEAKERFQLIQQAYEVLSDAHERAWYDNHREQILRGKNSDYEENTLDLFQYFTGMCFKGYGDDEKGFYAVYREVFQNLATEDAEFVENEEEIASIPTFGDSKSNYEDVVGPFYAYWQSYCTKKSYSWLCPYDIKEIKDRRILREIEKEMKKIVQKARKERNEEVRNLVSFIRKRDRRVQAYRQLLEKRAELNRQKQEQNRLDQIRKRQLELEEMRKNNHQHQHFNEGYEEQLKLLEQEYGVDSASEDEEEAEDDVEEVEETEEDYVDKLYCVACNKSFKNVKALTNHGLSKKHRDNLERMKLEMQEEEETFGEIEDADEVVEEASEVDETDLNCENEVNGEEADDDAIPSEAKSNKNRKKGKKPSKVSKIRLESSSDHDLVDDKFISAAKNDDSSENEDWNSGGKKGAKKNKNKNKKQTKKSTEVKLPTATETTTEVPKEAPAIEALRLEEEAPEMSHHVCATCAASFESKNKLFAHLKKTNHGVYIPKVMPTPKAPTKKGAKGKRPVIN